MKGAGLQQPREGTIGEALVYLLPRLQRARACPAWPPDLFALAASLLDRTGAYVHIVNHWPIDPSGADGDWRGHLRDIARDWRRRLDPPSADWPRFVYGATRFQARPPPAVVAWWDTLCAAWDTPLDRVRANHHPALLEALVGLLAAADEVCANVGLVDSGPFVHLARVTLWRQGQGRTACREVSPAKARVLPKQHTPQRGLTLRSLSANLALVANNDLDPVWRTLAGVPPRPGLNVLLLPWPLELETRQFQAHKQARQHRCALPEPYGFFRFEPNVAPEKAAAQVTDALARAVALAGDIDMVVLPELALTAEALDAVRGAVLAHNPNLLLVAGVWGLAEGDAHPSNHVSVSVPARSSDRDGPDTLRATQRKHHRWCLDRNQVLQYGLGGSLTATRLWWEHSEVTARELNFVTIHDWLTFCPLICEDLARQDPAADVLRAIGPNLVIALLMDGPQLPSRWPGRYASVLAEDPGSSVLTLTSLGMSRLSRPAPGHTSRDRVVGLWRDAVHGEQLLELDEGADGLVLSFAPELREEWTADGRRDGGTASFPVYCGVRSVPRGRG